MATTTVVLYARICEPAHTGVQEVADLAGISSSKLVEALLCSRLDIPHPHTATANTALRRWKQGERAA